MEECEVCDRITSGEFTCDICKTSQYCSSYCQEVGTHRMHKLCKPPGSRRSVDYLYLDVFADNLPTNEETIRDYGFANCKTKEEWIQLFGLYIGLLKALSVSEDVLHDYCMKDEIAVLIKQEFEELPMNSRGSYYPWFLQHQYIVKNGKELEAETVPKNLGESSTKPTNDSQTSVNFSIRDGELIINYGYKAQESYYYLNVQDLRLARQYGLPKDIEKVTIGIDSTGRGILTQLHTSSSSTVKGHQVSVETLAVFCKRYGIQDEHIETMKNGEEF